MLDGLVRASTLDVGASPDLSGKLCRIGQIDRQAVVDFNDDAGLSPVAPPDWFKGGSRNHHDAGSRRLYQSHD